MTKKLFTLVLTLVIVLTLIVPVSAENISSNVNLDSNDPDLEISDVMTYDEMVIELMENENKTKEEAIKTLGSKMELNTTTGMMTSKTYRTIGKRFTVTSQYRPQMRFYCQTEEGYYFTAIVEILNIGMNREYNGMSKQFTGDVYVHFKHANEIFFIVNGDFYNYGTTSGGFNGNLGINEIATVGFSISGSSDHYEYCYIEDSCYF